jgi:hypothetical protein
LPVSNSDNIRIMSSESGDGIRPPSPESGQPRFQQPIWPDPGRPAGIWPEPAGSGRDPIGLARSPGSGRSGQRAGLLWPDPSRLWPERPDSGQMPAGSGQIRPLRLNPAIPDSDKTVRIPAIILNSDCINRNQVKMVRILSVSDGISLSMIFILFYINIYMF